MTFCINKNSIEYQSLKHRAGIPELLLDATCSEYLEKYGRFPHLDEIPGSDSSKTLKEELNIKKNNTSKISKILEYSGTSNIYESSAVINNIHRDLEVEITPIRETAFVDIKKRPTDGIITIKEVHEPDSNINNQILILQALNKLSKIYGIKVRDTNEHELNSDEWSHLMPKDKLVNGFIYNGEIYLNVDRASVDTPVHELLHLLVGSIRFSDPQLYSKMIKMAEELPAYDSLLQEFPNRSRNDANEEIFIQEISKHLTGLPSQFENLPQNIINEINYNVRRVLDSILDGDASTKTLSDKLLYKSTLKQVASMVNSNNLNNTFSGTFNVEGSALHRKLNNLKSDLINKGELTEICD